MQKQILVFAIVLTTLAGIASCGAKCKTCQADVMGVKSPEQELCGDQLKQAEKTPGMVCR